MQRINIKRRIYIYMSFYDTSYLDRPFFPLFNFSDPNAVAAGQSMYNNFVERLREEKQKEELATRIANRKKSGAKVKLRLTNYDWKESFKDVMFNPEQFGDTKSVNYGTINAPMQSYPRHVYQGGDVTTLNNIELYYNHNSPARVREMVLWLQDFLPYAQDGVTVRVPPTLLFSWGYWYTKRCILKSLSTDYTMFNEDLQPIECKITLDLEVVPIGTDPWTPQPWEVLR